MHKRLWFQRTMPILEQPHSEPAGQTAMLKNKVAVAVRWVCSGSHAGSMLLPNNNFWRRFFLHCAYNAMHSALISNFHLSVGFDVIPSSQVFWYIHCILMAKRTPTQLLTPCSHIRVIYRKSRMHCLFHFAAGSWFFEQYVQVLLIPCSQNQTLNAGIFWSHRKVSNRKAT